jgi:hypothetical protein
MVQKRYSSTFPKNMSTVNMVRSPQNIKVYEKIMQKALNHLHNPDYTDLRDIEKAEDDYLTTSPAEMGKTINTANICLRKFYNSQLENYRKPYDESVQSRLCQNDSNICKQIIDLKTLAEKILTVFNRNSSVKDEDSFMSVREELASTQVASTENFDFAYESQSQSRSNSQSIITGDESRKSKKSEFDYISQKVNSLSCPPKTWQILLKDTTELLTSSEGGVNNSIGVKTTFNPSQRRSFDETIYFPTPSRTTFMKALYSVVVDHVCDTMQVISKMNLDDFQVSTRKTSSIRSLKARPLQSASESKVRKSASKKDYWINITKDQLIKLWQIEKPKWDDELTVLLNDVYTIYTKRGWFFK